MTADEAAVIRVLRKKREASVFDVAVVAKMSPNTVREVVRRLKEERLIEESADQILKLTKQGETLTGEAAPVQFSSFASSAEADDALAEAESALDAVISRL
jgi:DNA-binding MarR family transcriptional regulator